MEQLFSRLSINEDHKDDQLTNNDEVQQLVASIQQQIAQQQLPKIPKKKGRPKTKTDEEKKLNAIAYQRQYYLSHRKQCNDYQLQWYHKKKQALLQQKQRQEQNLVGPSV